MAGSLAFSARLRAVPLLVPNPSTVVAHPASAKVSSAALDVCHNRVKRRSVCVEERERENNMFIKKITIYLRAAALSAASSLPVASFSPSPSAPASLAALPLPPRRSQARFPRARDPSRADAQYVVAQGRRRRAAERRELYIKYYNHITLVKYSVKCKI